RAGLLAMYAFATEKETPSASRLILWSIVCASSWWIRISDGMSTRSYGATVRSKSGTAGPSSTLKPYAHTARSASFCKGGQYGRDLRPRHDALSTAHWPG